MGGIGILAYGLLIFDPGIEIEPLIVQRITTLTPFPVEYARISRTRDGAPTEGRAFFARPLSNDLLKLFDMGTRFLLSMISHAQQVACRRN
jgi:hypothetical protein